MKIKKVPRKVAISKLINFAMQDDQGSILIDMRYLMRKGCRGYENQSNEELAKKWKFCFNEEVQIID